MTQPEMPAYFGPYRLVRALVPGTLGDRWLALHARQKTSHVVHRFPACEDRAERRRYLTAFEKLSSIRHPHILPIEQMSFGHRARAWAVTPYTGNADGLVTLDRLRELKGGRMGVFETERAIAQLLEASSAAHEQGLIHGPLREDRILVDRHGSLAIEHYGLDRTVHPRGDADGDATGDEIRSIAEIGYQCLTGLEPGEPAIRASRIDRRLDRRWDEWFERGLDPSAGFACALEALEVLPSRLRQSIPREPSQGPVRVVLRRFRTAATRPPPGTGETG